MSTAPNRFLSIDDLAHLPTPKWLIDGLFEADSLTMMAGPSGSFKSLLLLDWMLCMASGRKWMGRPTVSCQVAYALGEGKASLLKRINAWTTFNNISKDEFQAVKDNFRVSFEMPQMADKKSVDSLLADLEKEFFEPRLIAIDTFARSMVGLDENDAKDSGRWIESADRLRQLGYGVIFLHHTRKNTEFGVQYRGSSAIIGAMDTAMTLVREKQHCTLEVTKQKDHSEGEPLRFRLIPVNIGTEDSCVLVPAPSINKEFREVYVADVPEPPDIIEALMQDPAFKSDRARAKVLAEQTGISEGAAQARISRKRVDIP